MTVEAAMTSQVIRPGSILSRVGSERDGATVLFLGHVRNHADGRSVRGLRYEAYEAMATPVLRAIADEAARVHGIEDLYVVHRTGELAIGEVSVAIAASSPHREASYRASRQVIEEIKKRLPVWKKELYADGEEGWVSGSDPGETVASGKRGDAS